MEAIEQLERTAVSACCLTTREGAVRILSCFPINLSNT